MRYLNKIIFINSANIPYQEVSLDGNVHFSGTQGVGKSTVLRAILFFYTADKMRLGIQPGQKRFEEFYLPYSNSYILYEVKTDHGAYTIMLARSKGNAAFRFIDSAYNKDWIVDSTLTAESDWIRIRERIGTGVDISPVIDTYELYRNIIFGNTHDRSRRYDKYAIVESAKYQNIPRSIQNVFLNSKLDADFIKDTIIQSMTDIEDSINLSAYRPQVADFEKEFDDISCWFKKDANGEIAVRVKAEKVIATYQLLVAVEHELLRTWHRLNHSVNATKDRIPMIEEEIYRLKSDIGKIIEKIKNIAYEYQKKHDALNRKIGACEESLNTIRKKRKRYADMDIHSMVARHEQLPALQNELSLKNQLLQTIEYRHRDITEKYRRIRETIDNEFATFERTQAEAMQELRARLQNQRDKLAEQRDKRLGQINSEYEDKLRTHDESMQYLQAELTRADKRLSEVKYMRPLENEERACKEEIRELKDRESSLASELKIAEHTRDGMRQEADIKIAQAEKEHDSSRKSLLTELESLKAEVAATEEILSRLDGSLYHWLTANMPGWEENIGKVADEHGVLYATGLNPRKAEDNGFFGISIDLEALESRHRTPDQYRTMLKEQNAAIEAKKEEINNADTDYHKQTETVRKKYNNELKEWNQRIVSLKYDISLIPQKIKDAETRLRLIGQQQDELKKAEKVKRQAEYDEALKKHEQKKSEREKLVLAHEKDIRRIWRDYHSSEKELDNEISDFRSRQQAERNQKVVDIRSQKETADSNERNELQGKGIKTTAIDQYRNEIRIIEEKIKSIEQERPQVYGYRKDEEELFSKEPELKDEKHRLEKEDAELHNAYNEKRLRSKNERDKLSNILSHSQRQLETMQEGLKQYRQLCDIENIVPDTILLDDKEEKNDMPCDELVSEMRGAVNRHRLKLEELKRNVNSFNSNFSTNNTFNFVTPRYEEEYRAFADTLKDFMENNVIETYRERVSGHYSAILNSISREVGLLMDHSAEIKGIINDVNKDFRERTFAGVIRSIELRAEETSDRMMLLLQSIRDFTEENMMSFGELNLFSDDNHEQVNLKVVEYLKKFMTQLQREPSRTSLTLSDTFRLQFRIQENDNDTGWVERISNVGSDGTDILVKAMVNIMLINVFKTKAARKNGDFAIHCMMDEIGKLHPSNVSGILQFANVRNIYLINSSPMGYNAHNYRHSYLLEKDSKAKTHVKRLATVNR